MGHCNFSSLIGTLFPRMSLIALTELQMETSQDQRLSQLLQIQQERAITTTEQSELATLMEIYQAGLMRKAQALNESVKRGLRQPLNL